MNRSRPGVPRDPLHLHLPRGRRALLAIPAMGAVVLVLLWGVIFARLSVERDATLRESTASAAILSSALEQHTVKAIHQVDQITRFVKYEYEKMPDHFETLGLPRRFAIATCLAMLAMLIPATAANAQSAEGRGLSQRGDVHQQPGK